MTTSVPHVSILMPVYNGARYLRDAIESLWRQSFADFEIVVIDDGSTDGTAAILQSWTDPRLQVVRQDHLGLIPALQHAHRRAMAPYLARMDADDVSEPSRLARQLELFERRPDVAVATCRCRLLDAHGQTAGEYAAALSDDLELEFAAGNPIVHGSVLMRREAFEAAGGYVETPEDYALWLRMLSLGCKFHVIPEVLYGFRTHPDRYSLTHARSQSAGIVRCQLPLLERCTASRDARCAEVRAKLIRGWGTLGSAAYCAGQTELGRRAYQQFRHLARGTRGELLESAVLHGAEALVWGGCPSRERLALRLLEIQLRPWHGRSYRKLLLGLPFVQSLRDRRRTLPADRPGV